MFSKNELKLAYGLIAYFLFVGVLCYAAFPPQTPDEPIRLKFEVAACNVIFEHKRHFDVEGFGVSCGDCHHTLEEDEYAEAKCPVCSKVVRLYTLCYNDFMNVECEHIDLEKSEGNYIAFTN